MSIDTAGCILIIAIVAVVMIGCKIIERWGL